MREERVYNEEAETIAEAIRTLRWGVVNAIHNLGWAIFVVMILHNFIRWVLV